MKAFRWLDTLFALLLVLLGAAHLLAAFVPRLAPLRGPWDAGAAVAIVTMGLMNAVRSQRASDRLLRWTTALATLLTTALCFGVLYRYPANVLHQPAALAVAALAVAELLFAIAG
jgi:ABC-type multidrug transport system fused ATPase/permease subunit